MPARTQSPVKDGQVLAHAILLDRFGYVDDPLLHTPVFCFKLLLCVLFQTLDLTRPHSESKQAPINRARKHARDPGKPAGQGQ